MENIHWNYKIGATENKYDKVFIDDLLLGRGFVRSKATPLLRSIKSQCSTRGLKKKERQEKKT